MTEIEVSARFTGTISASGVFKLRQLFSLRGQRTFEHEHAPAAEAVVITLDPVRDEGGAIALGPVRTSEVGS